jgi:glutathione S-transferase
VLTLYELSGKNDERFSPFCWRARFAIAHKELEAAYVPVRFTDKQTIAFSGQERVPVLVDGNTTVSDSWKIACYLEQSYPDRPSLFGGKEARALTRFIDLWATQTLFPPLVRMVLVDVLEHLDNEDANYIRQSREQQLGMTWDALRAERHEHKPVFQQHLALLRRQLRRQPFLAGSAPAYVDYSVFGLLQWARMISDYPLFDAKDNVQEWYGQMAARADRIAAAIGKAT